MTSFNDTVAGSVTFIKTTANNLRTSNTDIMSYSAVEERLLGPTLSTHAYEGSKSSSQRNGRNDRPELGKIMVIVN